MERLKRRSNEPYTSRKSFDSINGHHKTGHARPNWHAIHMAMMTAPMYLTPAILPSTLTLIISLMGGLQHRRHAARIGSVFTTQRCGKRPSSGLDPHSHPEFRALVLSLALTPISPEGDGSCLRCKRPE